MSPELDVVLINRHEVVGRRHFDLAHELFHILTWDAMPPEHSEEARETGGNRVEQLANNFASAVLMPVPVLDRFGDWSEIGEGELAAQLNAAADELQVTASALKWRLVALERLKPAMARAIPDAALRNNGRGAVSPVLPPPFSKPFMEVMALASVCRMHGARGGAPEGNRNALKNGACSAEALALSRHVRALARMVHKTLDAMK